MTRLQKRSKHIPERTCVACQQKRPKWELVRIVRTPQGTLEIDGRGKKAGRGAYLCRLQDCWEKGLKRKRLEHALKTEIIAEQRTELQEYSKTLPACSGDIERRSDLAVKELVDEAKSCQ